MRRASQSILAQAWCASARHRICEMAVSAVPVQQRLRFAAHGDGPYPADQDRVGMAVDRFIQFAIEHGQRILKAGVPVTSSTHFAP